MKILWIAVLAVVAAGCAGEPTVDKSPGAELTFDGLAPVRNSAFRNAWVDPDVDLTSYDKIILVPAEFEFRAVKKTPMVSSIRRGSQTEFWINDENRQRLVETVTAIFGEELGKSKHFTITEEPGPDTLVIIGALHDIVSRVPPELVGAGEIYLASVGEATLVLELRDSMSGETIYRAVDRRKIERPGDVVEANVVTTWAEVRRWARRWATRLRDGLDYIHD